MLQLGVLMGGGLTLAFTTIRKLGEMQHTSGWSAVMATSKDWHMIRPANDMDFPWTMYLGGIICISVAYSAANQFIVQRTLAANEWHARMGVVFADYLKFFVPLIIIVPGMVAPMLFPTWRQPTWYFPPWCSTCSRVGSSAW